MAAVIEIKIDDPGAGRSGESASEPSPPSGDSRRRSSSAGTFASTARTAARRMGQAGALMARSKKMESRDAAAAARRMGQAAALMARTQKKDAKEAAARDRKAAQAQRKQDAVAARNQKAVEQARKITEREAARQKREQDRREKQAEAKRVRDQQKKDRADEVREKKKQREAEAEVAARNLQIQAAIGGAAAAIIRGGGMGAAIGGAAGAVIGARFGGPAGAAVGGAVGEKVGGATDNPLKPVAEFGEKVARGDAIGAFNQTLGNVIPGMKRFGEAIQNVTDVVGAFAARGREISGYSGQIATAVAIQDVTRVMTDIREAQMLGDRYQKLIEAQTRLEETLKAGLLPLKEKILEVLPPIIDTMLQILIVNLRIADHLNPFGDLFKRMADEAERMRRALEGGGVFGDSVLIDGWVNAAAGMALAPGAAPAVAPAAPGAAPPVFAPGGP